MHIDAEQLLERLDQMVETGRITDEEAERLREAARSGMSTKWSMKSNWGTLGRDSRRPSKRAA